MADHWDKDQDFYEGDYVTLAERGDIWQVVSCCEFQGFADDHLLELRWIAGDEDPCRLVRFGSGTARKLSEMEVIALSSL